MEILSGLKLSVALLLAVLLRKMKAACWVCIDARMTKGQAKLDHSYKADYAMYSALHATSLLASDPAGENS